MGCARVGACSLVVVLPLEFGQLLLLLFVAPLQLRQLHAHGELGAVHRLHGAFSRAHLGRRRRSSLLRKQRPTSTPRKRGGRTGSFTGSLRGAQLNFRRRLSILRAGKHRPDAAAAPSWEPISSARAAARVARLWRSNISNSSSVAQEETGLD